MVDSESRKVRRPIRLALTGIVILVLVGAIGGGYVYCRGNPGVCFPGSDAAADDGSQIGSYLAGYLAQHRNDDAAAARFLRQALSGDPDNRRLLHRTFVVSLLAGEMERTVEFAQRIVSEGDEEALANLVIAVDEARQGNYEAAGRNIAAARGSMAGPNFLLPLLQAWTSAAAGDTDAALAALDELDPLTALRPYVDLHRALINDLAGRTEAADRLYDQAAGAAETPTMRTIEHIAIQYARHNQRERGLELLRRYLEERPDSEAAHALAARIEAGETVEPPVTEATDGMAEALFAFAGILQSRNNSEQALSQARLAAYLRPEDGATLALMANILEQRDQLDRAIDTYLSVGAASPYYWESRLSAASLLAQQERYDEAASLLGEMAEAQPNRWDALFVLGGVYRAQEDWPNAIEAYEEAIARVQRQGQLEQRHWRLLYAKGIAHHQADQWPQAEAAFLRALELQPREPDVMNYLAYSWVERREHLDRALQMLEDAVQIQPTAGYIVDSVGWAYYQLGQFDRAVGYLERAAELMPGDVTINDHLGDALWRVGRRHEARFQWRRALSLNPEEELAAGIRDKLENGMPALAQSAGDGGEPAREQETQEQD